MSKLRNKAQNFSIFFRGTFPKENMMQVLQSIDFLVIPARWYENSPLVLLNALASHTPVVISNVEGMTEFVENGKNGFVFLRDDKNDLARVLKHIISNPELAVEMAENTTYPKTTEEMTKEIVAIYNKILS